jgi:hypothetical protein
MTATAIEITPQISDRQLAANRTNALQSTGPQTPAGKQRASANAVRHGFLARVLPESTPGWKNLLEGLYRSLRPADETQQLLVDQIAIAYVRLSRIYEAEQRAHKLPPYVANHIEELQLNAEKAHPSARQYLGTIVGIARDLGNLHLASAYYGSNAARTMARYESTLNRQIQRNLQFLWLLQSRSQQSVDEAEPADPPPFYPFDPPSESDPDSPDSCASASSEPPIPSEPSAESTLQTAITAPDSRPADYDPGYANEMAGYNPSGSIQRCASRSGPARRSRGR